MTCLLYTSGGAAIPTYYRLQREHIPFAAGILFENDVEYPVATALASKVITAKAFYPMEEAQLEEDVYKRQGLYRPDVSPYDFRRAGRESGYIFYRRSKDKRDIYGRGTGRCICSGRGCHGTL